MHTKLEQLLYRFLKKYYNADKPILLGLSGGPDSLCLLHLLLKFREKNPLNLHIAHVDHGWRKESREEAVKLQQLAERFNLPFHCHCLEGLQGLTQVNLEEACRNQRLLFFSKLCSEVSCQAVLFAHHADDQAETVLKRLFETASLPGLSGMKSIGSFEGPFGTLNIWRPLLDISKKEIEKWLQKYSLEGFKDSTNLDTRFLRAKFRIKLIPYLSKEFGKEIQNSLSRLGKEAQELKEYLDEKVHPYLNLRQIKPFGSLLDLSEKMPHSLVEIKHLLRSLGKIESLNLSAQQIDTMAEFLMSNAADKEIRTGLIKIYINRRRIFCFVEKQKRLPST